MLQFSLNVISTGQKPDLTIFCFQVVKEACITVAYLAEIIPEMMTEVCEPLFNNTLALENNSDSVIETSRQTCMKFIIKNIQSKR